MADRIDMDTLNDTINDLEVLIEEKKADGEDVADHTARLAGLLQQKANALTFDRPDEGAARIEELRGKRDRSLDETEELDRLATKAAEKAVMKQTGAPGIYDEEHIEERFE